MQLKWGINIYFNYLTEIGMMLIKLNVWFLWSVILCWIHILKATLAVNFEGVFLSSNLVGFFASCFEIKVFYFTNLDTLFFLNNKTFPLLVITYLTFYLYIFSRHYRFAETHRYLQLSYQITDRLLAAGKQMLFSTHKHNIFLHKILTNAFLTFMITAMYRHHPATQHVTSRIESR